MSTHEKLLDATQSLPSRMDGGKDKFCSPIKCLKPLDGYLGFSQRF